MAVLQVLFWLSVGCVLYTYIGYPLFVWIAARVFGRAVRRGSFDGSVSIVLCAFNEQQRIAARRDELIELLKSTNCKGELIIVSDGSTDGTAAAARNGAGSEVKVVELSVNEGKASALSRARSLATGDVLVFADARQRWEKDAIARLLENFNDPTVGGVSGELLLDSSSDATAAVGLYWRFEKWLRRQESRLHSTVGVTGAISAVRSSLFSSVPMGIVLDDVYWPLVVAMQGFRVVHDERARAHDRLPERTRDELGRKVRTLSGNFQLLARLPSAILPVQTPIWFQFLSHKLMRLIVPWALLLSFVCSVWLTAPLYRIAFALQLVFYALALSGAFKWGRARIRLASAASSFVVLNAAAWIAFWVWLSGKSSRSWRKVSYQLGAAR